jgi:type IV secretion system protein VirB10
MRANRQPLVTAVIASLIATGSWAAIGQSPDQATAGSAPPSQPTATTNSAAAPAAAGASEHDTGATVTATAVRKTYIVPAGTKVLLTLRSSVNTKSAKPGDGVYLASAFPMVVGNRVMIPTGVYVQGVVDRVQRAGHVKGRAQLDMHFTSIIFPNGSVVEIPGLVDSLPGARKQQVKDDGEGTIQQDGDKARNMGKVAAVAIPTGGTVGSISGLDSGHPLEGGLIGMGAGLATAGVVALFTRGADVNIETGTQVEMVLQRPLILEDANLRPAAEQGVSPSFVPVDDQPRPMDKPQRVRVMCPPGTLGCE